jgi:SAM-dependent methyltransferase
VDAHALLSLASRFLLVTGDRGPAVERTQGVLAELAGATHVVLQGYSGLLWDDVVADHPGAIGTTMQAFLHRMDQQQRMPAVTLPEGTGEHAGLFYRIQSAGPPLVLFPLGLARSQWEPLIHLLAMDYCTITLGGPAVGMVAALEERSRAGYLRVMQHLVDEMAPQPGETVLEVGCGSGVLTRWLAHRTRGANRLVGVDVNPYLLREAGMIARHAHLEDVITFQEGNAEDLPFPERSFDLTMSCTLLEEVDADRAVAELVRVTKPGGRVGNIVRAMDMSWSVNLPLDAPLKTVVEAQSRMGMGIQARGCADASLYRRLKDAGLVDVRMVVEFASYTEGPYWQGQRWKLLLNLSPEDTQRCREAIAHTEARGPLVIAEPFHCAVGTRP